MLQNHNKSQMDHLVKIEMMVKPGKKIETIFHPHLKRASNFHLKKASLHVSYHVPCAAKPLLGLCNHGSTVQQFCSSLFIRGTLGSRNPGN